MKYGCLPGIAFSHGEIFRVVLFLPTQLSELAIRIKYLHTLKELVPGFYLISFFWGWGGLCESENCG